MRFWKSATGENTKQIFRLMKDILDLEQRVEKLENPTKTKYGPSDRDRWLARIRATQQENEKRINDIGG